MRTIVYIDGFNLYYSLLTKTAYKWLDLKRLFDGLVRPIEPAAEIALVKSTHAIAVVVVVVIAALTVVPASGALGGGGFGHLQ